MRNVAAMTVNEIHRGGSKWIHRMASAYSSSSLVPTMAMMTKAPSTSVGYFRTMTRSCEITTRMATIPIKPPASTTQVFDDIATATRIESTENATLTSSTFTMVPQSADNPSHGLAGRG